MHASYGAKSINVTKVDKMSEASLPNVDSILSSYEKDTTTMFGARNQYPKSTSQGIVDLE